MTLTDERGCLGAGWRGPVGVYKKVCRIAQKIGQSVAIVLKVAGSSPAAATNGETAAALPHSCHNV